MNIEKLAEIAEWLEADTPRRGNLVAFNMVDFAQPHPGKMVKECGTACCIAGAAVFFDNMRTGNDVNLSSPNYAGSLLGLSDDQRDDLFYPWSWDGVVGARDPKRGDSWRNISPSHAARVIRHLIATGDVDWNVTKAAA